MSGNIREIYASIKRGFNVNTINEVEYLTVPEWERFPGLVHAFSTRGGGMSEPPYDSMNLNPVRPSSQQGVSKNYLRVAGTLDINMSDLVLLNYEHGDGVEIVRRRHRGMGFSRKNELPFCDAMITDETGVVFVTLHADCSCFMIYDPVRRVIAACHAGWKGILLRLGQKTIERMCTAFRSDPADCLVGIGPGICANCFVVDSPVAEQYESAYPDIDAIRKREDGKYLIDLTKCAVKQFLDAGIRAENMTVSGDCTYEQSARYYSYRRDGANAGSMAGFLGLR